MNVEHYYLSVVEGFVAEGYYRNLVAVGRIELPTSDL
jgi:hypothetical protein